MEILNLVQGSDEWLAARLEHFTASEAPAMMGDSPWMTRDNLLKLKKTGNAEPVSPALQAIFDKGHATEALARPIIEEIIGDDLCPVTGRLVIDDLPLLSSYDGLTAFKDVVYEHKLWNETLAENVKNKVLEPKYYWQLEQELLVADADKALFVVSDGTEDNMEFMWYESVSDRRQALIAGWKRFATDLEEYVVKAVEEKIVTEKRASLPMVRIETTGEVSIASNLDEFRTQAVAFIGSIKTDLKSNADFEQASVDIKALKKAEDQLKEAKQAILNGYQEVSKINTVIDELQELCRSTRLKNNTQVENRKTERKGEIVTEAQSKLDEYYGNAISDLRGYHTPPLNYDFKEVIKGKSNFDNMESDVGSMLAKVKDEIDAHCATMKENIASLDEHAKGYEFLFTDFAAFVSLEPDHARLSIKERVKEHQEVEAKKQKVSDNISKLKSLYVMEDFETPQKNIDAINGLLIRIKNEELSLDLYGDRLQEAGNAVQDSINKLEKARDDYQSMIDEAADPEVEEVAEEVSPESETVPVSEVEVSHSGQKCKVAPEEEIDFDDIGLKTEEVKNLNGQSIEVNSDSFESFTLDDYASDFHVEPGLYKITFERIED